MQSSQRPKAELSELSEPQDRALRAPRASRVPISRKRERGTKWHRRPCTAAVRQQYNPNTLKKIVYPPLLLPDHDRDRFRASLTFHRDVLSVASLHLYETRSHDSKPFPSTNCQKWSKIMKRKTKKTFVQQNRISRRNEKKQKRRCSLWFEHLQTEKTEDCFTTVTGWFQDESTREEQQRRGIA